MARLLMGYQAVLLYNSFPLWERVGGVAVVALGALVAGTLVFDRFRWTFAEEV